MVDGKRSYPYEQGNGRQKKRGSNDSDEAFGDIEYRILCPLTKVGGLIGKGGNVIKSLGRETRSKIAVEDAVAGAEERVVYISSSAKAGANKDDNDEEMQCAAQEALFRVFAKVIEPEDNEETATSITVRLLVPSSQVGCLLGKAGKIIEQMRKDIACQIRVMPKDKFLPPYVTAEYDLVQLSGEPALVRKALYAVSTRLFKTPPRESTQGIPALPQLDPYAPPPALDPYSGLPGVDPYSTGSFYRQMEPLVGPPSAGTLPGYGYSFPPIGSGKASSGLPLGSGGSILPPIGGADRLVSAPGPEEEFTVRILSPNDKVGSIIGKGGNVVKKLQEETGSKISVSEPISGSDERVVKITATEFLDSRISPAIDAALQVQKRLAEASSDKDKDTTTITTRLLVPSSQIGSLLGKGGQIISEMRKTTKAKIQIPTKVDLPPCADENDGLVQISGEPRAAQAALVEILQKLRRNIFKDYDVGTGRESALPSLSDDHLYGASYRGRPDFGSPRSLYPGLGLAHSLSYTGYGSPPPVPTFSARVPRDTRRVQR